jgi:hypothetical protein
MRIKSAPRGALHLYIGKFQAVHVARFDDANVFCTFFFRTNYFKVISHKQKIGMHLECLKVESQSLKPTTEETIYED